jgi:hypothetical protein
MIPIKNRFITNAKIYRMSFNVTRKRNSARCPGNFGVTHFSGAVLVGTTSVEFQRRYPPLASRTIAAINHDDAHTQQWLASNHREDDGPRDRRVQYLNRPIEDWIFLLCVSGAIWDSLSIQRNQRTDQYELLDYCEWRPARLSADLKSGIPIRCSMRASTRREPILQARGIRRGDDRHQHGGPASISSWAASGRKILAAVNLCSIALGLKTPMT